MSKTNWRDPRLTCELFCILEDDNDSGVFSKNPQVKVVEEFKAKSYDEAIAYTKQYRNEHQSDGWTYYWRVRHSRDLGDYGLWHCDGICSWGASDVDCVFIDWIAKVRVRMRKDMDFTNRKSYVKKIARIRRLSSCKVVRGLLWCWLKFWDNLTWHLWHKPIEWFKDWCWNRRNTKNWKKTGHALSEYWSLELHLLKDLQYNLRKLNEIGYGINTEFMYDVLRERHKDEPNFDVEKEMTEIMMNSDRRNAERIENLAVKRQKETYERIAHLVDLYIFYVNQEIDDKEPKQSELTDDMHIHLIECTYDMIDYKKMVDESKVVWNEIWDLVKRYGQQMGD